MAEKKDESAAKPASSSTSAAKKASASKNPAVAEKDRAERDEFARVADPADGEERELSKEEEKAVDEWYQQHEVRDPSDRRDFARTDQHPSFSVPTAGENMSGVEEPEEA